MITYKCGTSISVIGVVLTQKAMNSSKSAFTKTRNRLKKAHKVPQTVTKLILKGVKTGIYPKIFAEYAKTARRAEYLHNIRSNKYWEMKKIKRYGL